MKNLVTKNKRKSIFWNYIFNTIYTLLNIVFPLLTAAYTSRVLLSSGVGKVAFAASISSYFLIVAQLGIPKYGPREIAKRRNDYDKRNMLFWDIFVLNAISTASIACIYYTFISFSGSLFENKTVFFVLGLTIVLNLFNVDWFYIGLEEYKYITIRSSIIKILSLIALFLFVKKESDYVIYAFIYCFGIGANYLFNIFHLRKYISKPTTKPRIKKHLKPVLFLLSMTAAVELYSQLDTTMIGFMCGDDNVAFYTNPMKMIRITTALITSLSTVLLPRLSWYYENKEHEKIKSIVEKTINILITFSVPACFGLLVVSKPLIYALFGDGFSESVKTIRILSFMIPIMSIGNLFGTQILLVVNQEKKLLITVLVGALINVLLNSFLIRIFAQNGAALASVASELIVMVLQIAFAIRYVKIKIKSSIFIKTVVGSEIMIISLPVLLFKISPYLQLIIIIPICVLSYFLIEVLLQNETIPFIFKTMKEKIFFKRKDA